MSGYAFHPLAEIFPLLEGPEFTSLVDDIAEHGQRELIVLFDGKILDGRNRYRACEAAGIEPKFAAYEGDDPAAFVVSLNLRRRHMDESQRALSGAKLANIRLGDNQHKGSPIGEAISQSKAAELLNVGKRSIERAREVIDDGAPELIAAVERGSVSVSAAADVATLPKAEQAVIVARGEKEILQAAKDIRQRRVEDNRDKRAAEKVAAMAAPVPTGKYRTIVIDPPWDMEKIVRDNRPNPVNFGFEYPTMSEEELLRFDVPGIAGDDCHLFCWTTQRFLPTALRLVEGWGFRYTVCMVWHKAGGYQPYNLPQFNCEFVVYARKGSPEFVETKAFFTCFSADRREHSRKPNEFYDVVRRVAPGPRIDVFSREARDGFDQFGNEADKFAGAA